MPATTQLSKWTPPDPASSGGDPKDGHKLLSLIRSIEKEEEDSDEFQWKLEEALALMKNLISIYARQGLLRGDLHKAEQIMASSGDGNEHQGRSKNRRGRRKEDKKIEERALGEASSSVSSDESLMLSALLRIFGFQGAKLQSMLPLVDMAANLCTAISDKLKAIAKRKISTVGSAEYELFLLSGVPILRGLAKVSSAIISRFGQECHSGQSTAKPLILLGARIASIEECSTLKSCLCASATIVSLFGTKLSRSTGLMIEIRFVAWSALTIPEGDIQSAAAQLIATLPLAGAATGGDQKDASCIQSPAEQWSHSLMDCVVALSTILKRMVPVSQNMFTVEQHWEMSAFSKCVVEGATLLFHNNLLSDEKARASAFRFLIHGFSSLTLALLSRDYHGPGNATSLLDARLCVYDILGLLETMLSFPVASESLFYITKKRLRLETIEGGIMNPTTIASEIANYIKLSGHRMLNTLLSAVGGPVLLPYANRILRMVSSALMSSCSGPLRKSLDSTGSAIQLEGTKRRWLHTSVAMRSESVKSVSAAVSMFGLEPARSHATASAWASSKKSTNFDKCLTLVGGCLLEQLAWDGGATDDWGTLSERAELAVSAAESMRSIILSCGGFMPLAIRALFDSIATTGLQCIISPIQNEIAATAEVKVAILEIGAACLTSPWPNGAASSILEQVRISCSKCKTEDRHVSSAATATLRLCDSILTPRVPALHVVTKRQVISSNTVPVSSNTLVESIENAQEKITRQREDEKRAAQEEAEQNNKRRKVAVESKAEKSAQTVEIANAQLPKQEKETGVVTEVVQASNALKQDKATGPTSFESQEVMELETFESGQPLKSPTANQADSGDAEDDFLPGIVDDDGPDEEDL